MEIKDGSIRPYQDTDEKTIVKILKEPGGHYYPKDELNIDAFENYVYENNGEIQGLLCIEIHDKISQLIPYVAPSQRRQGIGSQLFEFGKQRLRELDPNTIWVFFRNDVGSSATFYENRGVQPWYSYHHMIYDLDKESGGKAGQKTTQSFDKFDRVINYDPQYFEEYLTGRSRAFLKINQLTDTRPHDEAEQSDVIKKWAEKHEKDIWLFFKEEKLVGSIAVYQGFFDVVFVVPEEQGKGVGDAIVLWAIEHCRSNGWKPELCVVNGNQPAFNLYRRTGFQLTQTLGMMRFFSENKEPDLRGPIGG